MIELIPIALLALLGYLCWELYRTKLWITLILILGAIIATVMYADSLPPKPKEPPHDIYSSPKYFQIEM